MKDFEHPAQKCEGNRKLVYPAVSKHYFYFRMHISRYILEQGAVPLNPFMLFDYFLLDTIEREMMSERRTTPSFYVQMRFGFSDPFQMVF